MTYNQENELPRSWAATARAYALAMVIGIAPILCRAHNPPVHDDISHSAALSSQRLADFLKDYLGAAYRPELDSPMLGARSAMDWITSGSRDEDLGFFSRRSVTHFYTVTPTRERGPLTPGLTDFSETLGLGWWGPVNSFRWATDQQAMEPDGGQNAFTWPAAREHQYQALIKPAKEEREAELGQMFCALGHVIHLNQDLSHPDHVRNDEHAYHRYLEDFGNVYHDEATANKREHFKDYYPEVRHGWSWWKAEGFTQLLEFWDRANYMNGNPASLEADARGTVGQRLGLAEFCSGNFLSEDASYTEFWCGTGHHFPLPSLANTDQPQLKGPFWRIDPTTLPDRTVGQCVHISKLPGAGVPVRYHSVLKYLAALHPPKTGLPGMRVTLSIKDTSVMREYYDKLIPKAVEYSAGILDYFFRGQLLVTGGWDSVNAKYKVRIVNKSGQDFLGGTFRLFQDSQGNRTELAWSSLSYAGALPENGFVEGTVPGPVSTDTEYVVVYKGTIGSLGGNPSDPVDQEKAVAAQTFTLGPPVPDTIWDPDSTAFGTATISPGSTAPYYENRTSFGVVPTGKYKIDYESGVFCNVWHGSVGEPPEAFDFHIPWTSNPNKPGMGVSALPGGRLNGVAGDCFVQTGGDAIAIATRELNPVNNYVTIYSPREVELAFQWGTICESFETMDGGGGSATYSLTRTHKLINLPARVRVADWISVKPALGICSTCPNSTTEPEWDGTLPVFGAEWASWFQEGANLETSEFPPLALNGKVISSEWGVRCGLVEGYCWELEIYCGEDYSTVWYGTKSMGTSPAGTYVRDDTSGSCSEVESINIEEY